MLRLLIADFSRGLGMSVSGALYIFIAATYFDLPSHASIALLFYFLQLYRDAILDEGRLQIR